MSYTPAGIDLMLAACSRANVRRRVDAMHDTRAAMSPDPKAFSRLVREMERLTRVR